MIKVWEVFTKCSARSDHLQVTHKSKITKKRHRIMGGLYINEIYFVQSIGIHKRLIRGRCTYTLVVFTFKFCD